LFIYVFCSSGAWTQGLGLARWVLYHLSHSASPILHWVFFGKGSQELFDWGWLKPWSSCSLPL
jgi:hypothetical protein